MVISISDLRLTVSRRVEQAGVTLGKKGAGGGGGGRLVALFAADQLLSCHTSTIRAKAGNTAPRAEGQTQEAVWWRCDWDISYRSSSPLVAPQGGRVCAVERMAFSLNHRICLWLAVSLAQVLFVTCQDAKPGKLTTLRILGCNVWLLHSCFDWVHGLSLWGRPNGSDDACINVRINTMTTRQRHLVEGCWNKCAVLRI